MDGIERVLDEIEGHLAARKAAIKLALHNYPAPITGCDAQYNHLAEARQDIARDLHRLEALRRQALSGEALAAFAASSHLDDTVKQDLAARARRLRSSRPGPSS